jgi:hypothetical protein
VKDWPVFCGQGGPTVQNACFNTTTKPKSETTIRQLFASERTIWGLSGKAVLVRWPAVTTGKFPASLGLRRSAYRTQYARRENSGREGGIDQFPKAGPDTSPRSKQSAQANMKE